MEFFRKLLESDFMPHGHCYFWKPEILWLTVGGDALTGAAYFSIPFMLVYFAKSRQDLAHKYVFFLFGAFILLCGTTHIMDIWTAWVPTYRLASVIKMATGLLSIATAVVLYKSLPGLLAIPSNKQLREANRLLKSEIEEREKIQLELNQAKAALEMRVGERTAELHSMNKNLAAEIEEREKAQKELVSKNKDLLQINSDLDSFVYTASHDLKSPITNMEGLLTALREEMAVPGGEVEPLLERLEKSVERLNHTIYDLSNVSKVQRRSYDEKVEEIDMAQMVGQVLEGIHHMVEQSGVEISTDFSRQPSINFVTQHMQSILQNLLTNSIKYRSPHRSPFLKITTEETEEYAVLTVEDNGIGVDLNKHQNKLFQLFRRLHDHVEGSGVGLYVIKRIVDNYQGKIEVRSAPNEGAEFKIYFLKSSQEVA